MARERLRVWRCRQQPFALLADPDPMVPVPFLVAEVNAPELKKHFHLPDPDFSLTFAKSGLSDANKSRETGAAAKTKIGYIVHIYH
jgi:hypothetical protein